MQLPKLKDRVNTEKISLAVPAEMKKQLETLKYEKRINVSEFLRQVIQKEIEKINLSAL